MTEEEHEERGCGPLISLYIEIEPLEELRAYTGPDGLPGPALVCNDHWMEWVESQPEWLKRHFMEINPTHYRMSYK